MLASAAKFGSRMPGSYAGVIPYFLALRYRSANTGLIETIGTSGTRTIIIYMIRARVHEFRKGILSSMGRVSDFGSQGCRFEPCRVQVIEIQLLNCSAISSKYSEDGSCILIPSSLFGFKIVRFWTEKSKPAETRGRAFEQNSEQNFDCKYDATRHPQAPPPNA